MPTSPFGGGISYLSWIAGNRRRARRLRQTLMVGTAAVVGLMLLRRGLSVHGATRKAVNEIRKRPSLLRTIAGWLIGQATRTFLRIITFGLFG